MMRVVLASRSPRRREILGSLGVKFDVMSADADETCDERDPETLVRTLALRKGIAARELLRARGEWNDDTLIIASDTVVAANDEILGKPRDDADAARMLRMLSGSTHAVVSGVALLQGERHIVAAERTGVRFGKMTEAEIAAYVASGEPRDKAGAYAVQGLAAVYVEGIDGDYYNVVGLPVYRLNALLSDFIGKTLLEV